MKKSAVVIAGIFLLSMFSVLGSVSADVDGVFDIWEKDGAYEYVWWYNHDNSVCKGPEYQAKIAQLLADGYGYRGYAVTESVAGSGRSIWKSGRKSTRKIIGMLCTSLRRLKND